MGTLYKCGLYLRLYGISSLFRANRSEKGSGKSGSGINDYVTSLFDQSLTWKDIQWLKKITSLPIVLKGILHPEDAKIGKMVEEILRGENLFHDINF